MLFSGYVLPMVKEKKNLKNQQNKSHDEIRSARLDQIHGLASEHPVFSNILGQMTLRNVNEVCGRQMLGNLFSVSVSS